MINSYEKVKLRVRRVRHHIGLGNYCRPILVRPTSGVCFVWCCCLCSQWHYYVYYWFCKPNDRDNM